MMQRLVVELDCGYYSARAGQLGGSHKPHSLPLLKLFPACVNWDAIQPPVGLCVL